MTSRKSDPQDPSDLVAGAIKRTRTRRGWTAEQLAERCRALGDEEMTAAVIANIETGRRGSDGVRRRRITVEELLLFAYALDVAPLHLLLPVDTSVISKVAVGTSVAPPSIFEARAWVKGRSPLRGQDVRTYFTEVPPDEYYQALLTRRRLTKGKAELAEIEAEIAAFETDSDQEVEP